MKQRLYEILGAFNDARSVLDTAFKAMDGDEHGDEVVTLGIALGMLRAAYNALDIAIRDLPEGEGVEDGDGEED